jgi:hypothetical protein
VGASQGGIQPRKIIIAAARASAAAGWVSFRRLSLDPNRHVRLAATGLGFSSHR